jgi:predicted RNA-binding Zn ribbon-like protein
LVVTQDEVMSILDGKETDGPLCLAFANTVDWHASDHPEELLADYNALVGWARGAGLVTDEQALVLETEAARHPDRADAIWHRAVEVREAIYRLLVARVHGHPAAAIDLALFNEELARALANAQLVAAGDGYDWGWAGDEAAGDGAALDQPLWPVLRSAAELLAAPHLLARVGQCADDRGCGWLFLDMSRNRSRRWCDIRDCGNRAKQRRYYQRGRRPRG